MNLEPLMIGQNLLCRLTAEKAGLTCWALAAPGFSVELTGGWPGPGLSELAPCGGLVLPCCARLGLTLSTLALLGATFCLSVFGSLGGSFGASAIGLLGGRFGLSAFGLLICGPGLSVLGLLSGRLGLMRCRFGFTT